LLPNGDSLGKMVLFSVGVVDKSALSSVDPLDDESTLSGRKSDGGESPVSSVDPLSDAPSLLSVDPLAYMIAEAGKTIDIIIKNINEIFIRFTVAIAMTLHIKSLL
jgi:hypothetical protein